MGGRFAVLCRNVLFHQVVGKGNHRHPSLFFSIPQSRNRWKPGGVLELSEYPFHFVHASGRERSASLAAQLVSGLPPVFPRPHTKFHVSLAALNKRPQQGRKQSLKHFFHFAAESVNGAKVGQWACDRHIKGREMDRFFTTDHRLCRVCSCRCSSPYSIPDCDSEQNLKNE